MLCPLPALLARADFVEALAAFRAQHSADVFAIGSLTQGPGRVALQEWSCLDREEARALQAHEEEETKGVTSSLPTHRAQASARGSEGVTRELLLVDLPEALVPELDSRGSDATP